VKYCLLLILIGSLCLVGPATAGPVDAYGLMHPDIDWPMYDNPHFDSLVVQYKFNPKLSGLWLKALARPESELQFRAAEAIKLAYEMGMNELPEKVIEPLIKALNETDRQPIVHRAVVEALASLDARHAAPALLAANQRGDREVVLLSDAVLAAWDDAAARTVWRQRIAAADVQVFLKMSAIQSLGIVKDQAAVEILLNLVEDMSQVQSIRISAAQSLGQIVNAPRVNPAGQLASSNKMVNRLVAAHMLNPHRGSEAQSLLMKLADDKESAIATIAIRKLLADDPLHLKPLLASLIASDNANHRTAAIEVIETEKIAAGVSKLALLLADLNISVRIEASRAMVRLAKQSHLNDIVRSECLLLLGSEDWRGVEQAVMVLGQLDHEPACPQLLGLLEHSRHEVRLAAIVALRRIAVVRTYSAMLNHATQMRANRPSGANRKIWIIYVLELSQLCQAMGEFQYQPAMSMLTPLVPKSRNDDGLVRGSAVWALGRMHEGRPDAALASAFAGRLADVHGLEAEGSKVRRFSAIAIGMMKAKGHHDVLEEFYKKPDRTIEIDQACHWALQKTEGKSYPPPAVHIRQARGWFIEPISEK